LILINRRGRFSQEEKRDKRKKWTEEIKRKWNKRKSDLDFMFKFIFLLGLIVNVISSREFKLSILTIIRIE
jgi:hypothetical protein